MATKRTTRPGRPSATRARPAKRTAAPAKRATDKPTKKAESKPAVLVNEALRKRYATHLAAFRNAHGAEQSQWDAAFEQIDAILHSDPPLYLAGGFKTDKAFLASVLPEMDPATARENARVARFF